MLPATVLKSFGIGQPQKVEALSAGLIHFTYKVVADARQAYIIQKINTGVFKKPAAIQHNYSTIRAHLLAKGSFALPALVETTDGHTLFEHEGETWRCYEYISNTYSKPVAATAAEAFEVAYCFGQFTAGLHDLNTATLHTILPHFHNLHFRYQQFQNALAIAAEERKQSAAQWIDEVYEHKYLVDWFEGIVQQPGAYPLRVMHHDCKIANILFDKDSHEVVCPVDLDTTQQGYFFSDVGDMIRSMVPSHSESAVDIHALQLKEDFYKAIIDGYTRAMGALLTRSEKEQLSLAGPVMVFMQALRFLTDYLNGDTYYQISYPAQNLDRAANQFKLLQLLKTFLQY